MFDPIPTSPQDNQSATTPINPSAANPFNDQAFNPPPVPTATTPVNPFDDQSFNPPATAPVPEDTTPANFQLGKNLPFPLGVSIPPHQLQFDENKFLKLLAGSISLSKDEKKRIIETIPKLKQAQVDELMRIFEEEQFKFSQLSIKHVPQLEKLAQQHLQEWIDLVTEAKAQQKQSTDQAAADEIRKSLGL